MARSKTSSDIYQIKVTLKGSNRRALQSNLPQVANREVGTGSLLAPLMW